jgi:hypothetical protein
MNTRTSSDWRNSVIEYIRAESKPADKFGHQPRVSALAPEIGEFVRLFNI